MGRLRQAVTSLAVLAVLGAILGAILGAAVPAQAQDSWNPFREKDEAAKRAKKLPEPLPPALPPMDGAYPRAGMPQGGPEAGRGRNGDAPVFGAAYPGTEAPPAYAIPQPGPLPARTGEVVASSKVERLEIEPAINADSSGLPPDTWRGMDIKAVEEAFAASSMPPRSAVLHGLWTRLLTSSAEAPVGGQSPGVAAAHFEAVRLEALYRSGLLAAMGMRLEAVSPDDPIFQAFAIRRNLALGQREPACQAARKQMGRRADLPKPLVAELHLMAGYCAAAEGNAAGAGVAADLGREEGIDAPVALAALEALAGNSKGPLTPPKLVRVLDYRLLELLGPIDPAQVLDRAEPALVAALALQETAEPRTRIAAAEAAARMNAISADQLAAAYKTVLPESDDAALRRAELVRAIGGEANISRKMQLMKAALDEARRNSLLVPVARVLAPMLGTMAPSSETQAYAEVMVEIALAGGDTRKAREFATASGARHWLALIDIAEQGQSEQQREQNLAALDDLVRRGRLAPELLHRLATVLDATDVNVPLPLWEAASRTPQPSTGYLPETGVLAQLQDAAKKKDMARSILLAMRAIGPNGADGAHIIALGDTIRALRRVGMDREARALGVEALIAQWPHGGAS